MNDNELTGTLFYHCLDSLLSGWKYFEVSVYELEDEIKIPVDDSRFLSIIGLDGHGRVGRGDTIKNIASGESIFVHAVNCVLNIKENLEIIVSYINRRENCKLWHE